MKQFIDKEQWAEIDLGNRQFFQKNYFINSDESFPSIGQMIEFLGEDLAIMVNLKSPLLENKEWLKPLAFKPAIGWKIEHSNVLPNLNDELVDILWQAVKEKLKA